MNLFAQNQLYDRTRKVLAVIWDLYIKYNYKYLLTALTQKLKYFRFSGITKAIMDPVTMRLPDVQKKIRELLPANAILCGQSLGGDLRAIKVQTNTIIIIHFRYRYGKIDSD